MRDRLGPEPSVSRPVPEFELKDDFYYIEDPSKTSREEYEDRHTFDKILNKWLKNSESEMGEDPEKLKENFQYNLHSAADDYSFTHNTDRYAKNVENFQKHNRKAEESTNKHADWSRKSKAIARALKAAGYVEEPPKPWLKPGEDDWQLQGARDSVAELIPGISAEDIDRVIQEMTTGRADDGSFIMKPEYEDISEDEIKDRLVKFLKENKPEEVEEIIEEHPVESEQVIPDESPLNTEAEQVIDGGRDAEVRNDVVEKETKRLSEDFKDTDELYDYLTKLYADDAELGSSEQGLLNSMTE